MAKNLKIILLVLIILLSGAYIFYLLLPSEIPSSPPNTEIINTNTSTGLTEKEKENAAKFMNQQLTSVPPLTAKQKEDIANKMIQSLSK